MDDQAVLKAVIAEAHRRVLSLLEGHFSSFDARQQDKIRRLAGVARPSQVPRTEKKDAPPRYWLPFSGETWSGIGRPPKAFAAWEGTVAHTEWKKNHPNERFPRFPQ
ncbi:DNA-binding protein H-NS [Pseudoxanthomonas sp. GM95]|uniref:H-NS family nucleoid-associated regulatory protein n=1 Tax=Pseudoxanthomonas sp. GM95 TaxID=1881043 RepID=UPI0008CFE0D4|nr:H-NS family nucleoid-associated regulatory protein [Pseudoxanthomonas sp. GM95]SEL15056.1 DNA-binding protein H-NS [Pseudoxanthomonas sp. GM95]